MTLSTSIIVFYSTYTWAKNRKSAEIYLSKIQFSIKRIIEFDYLEFYDILWLWIYMFYIAGLLVIPCWLTLKNQLPIVSSSIILAEQVC